MLKTVLIIWLIANIFAFILMDADKGKAVRHSRRISEASLFLAAAFGGIGATLGMLIFRHKTRHWYFRIFLPLMALCQSILILWLASRF